MLGDSNSVDILRPPSVHMAKHRCVGPWSILCITRLKSKVEQVIFIMGICNRQYIYMVWHSKTKQKTSERVFSEESLVRYFMHTWLGANLSSLVFWFSVSGSTGSITCNSELSRSVSHPPQHWLGELIHCHPASAFKVSVCITAM